MTEEAVRRRLLEMARRDTTTRDRLAADGSLFDGYHPEMQTVHETNAAALEDIVERWGWPGRTLAGEDGAEAAWLIAQHAIGLPEFQRSCLRMLEAAAGMDDVPVWQPAYLVDRIRMLEGGLQHYGTQFDWDDAGEMSPLPIEDPDRVDARRAAVGLPPLAEAIRHHRKTAASQPRPVDREARRQGMAQWAQNVGWQ